MTHSASAARIGGLAAAAAFAAWGLLPIYWKALGTVPAAEILCHRIVWSVPFVALLLAATHRLGEIRTILADRRTTGLLTVSALLVGSNWFVYIWAVNNAHIVESSLGYYINPLVSMLLGFIFFRDRLNRVQGLAIGFAVCGVLLELWQFGRIPWIALVLAVTFGLYGLVRKIVNTEALPGLFVETAIMGVPAAAFLLFRESQGLAALGHGTLAMDALLVGAGAVTSLPLAAFAFGARRLRLTTVGVLQYLSPTGMFALGVFVYGEEFTAAHLGTFAFIWAGVALYMLDSIVRLRRTPIAKV
ncbi:chloramphenicol-sensitive protein RarD [Desulfobaculum xiamenense]|uniref:Chloramphenicol-sensitive protein RarD n=1 Tax=Desulfobaculum xiamenense TaxID=995050 RepID=A0A846QHM2_9BACT|nr:EamA family transporter RarD [Desulfobaculum xiamenense]NJB68336.1 chloramphenicol-sensitive protein RarD [Desulfobaculum xiamenense]